MPGRFLRTLMVLLTLCGVYLPYAYAVRALVGSPDVLPPPPPPPDDFVRPPDESSRVAREHLADFPWAADANIQLRDPNRLYYYTESWTQSEDKKSVEFEPLALVSFSGDSDEPLIIVADSAVLMFASAVELGESKVARIIGGTLKDDVLIQGPDNLEIRGRHFTFSESSARLWSDHPAEFKWLQNSGHADRVQVDLEVVESAAGNQPLAVSHVREIHLIRNVEMNLQLEQKDGTRTPLDVSCAGRFRCQLLGGPEDPSAETIGSFEDDVVVVRTISPGVTDRLTCETLDLYLQKPKAASTPTITAASVSENREGSVGSLFGAGEQDLQLRRMVASGELILLESASDRLVARIGVREGAPPIATSIDYQFDQKRAVLNKFNPSVLESTRPENLPRVLITQPDVRIDCLQVDLHHDSQNQLKEIICRGDGKLISWKPLDADGVGRQAGPRAIPVPVLTAAWRKQLRQYKERATGHDVIDISGDAVVRMPQDRAGISADYIKVWTDPLQRPAPNSGTSSGSPLPHRILAYDNVTLVSPEMQGRMDELQIWFEDAPPLSESTTDRRVLRTTSLRIPADAGNGPSRNPARQDQQGIFQVVDTVVPDTPGALALPSTNSDEPPRTAPAPLPDDLERPRDPVLISTRLARIRMLRRGPDVDPELAEVWTEGNVHITQRDKLGRTAVLQGDRLHLVNRSETDQIVHMFGQPASINNPQMNLSGEEIFLDRNQNLLWVDGRGTMTFPVDKDFEGKPLDEPTEMTISWLKQMAFDGLEAKFHGRVHARQLDNVLSCQRMEVTLAEPMLFQSMGDESAESPQPEVASIGCWNEVEVSSHQTENGSLKSVSRARFNAFALNNETGRVQATGPGVLATWTRGRGKRAGLAPRGNARANSGSTAESTGWEYTRISFVQDMIGQVQSRSALFRGQVNVVYGPVSESLEKIDIEKLPRDGGVMSCQQLEFSQPGDAVDDSDSESIVLLATGNARLEGQTFHALADEISYDESKGLYMLKSFGDRESMLWREPQVGGERSAVVTRTIRFNPSLNFFGLDSARRVQGLQ